MTREPIKNPAASIRARLLVLAQSKGQDYQRILGRYAIERFLYRLGRSIYRDKFVIKGATLFTLWTGETHRPTKDLDLLGRGSSAIHEVEESIRTICRVETSDGILFDNESVEGTRIKEEDEYEGVRVRFHAVLAGARIPMQVDIGFGDATEPGLTEMDLPVLLDFPAPHLRAYVRETVIAEKFQALVMLGRANSRMKDLYDIWVLSRTYTFEGDSLARAIAATFARRKTDIPSEPPDALTPAFAEDAAKIQQWNSFVEDVAFQPGSLAEVVRDLAAFLMPYAEEARKRQAR